jgi:hypothetical protein
MTQREVSNGMFPIVLDPCRSSRTRPAATMAP